MSSLVRYPVPHRQFITQQRARIITPPTVSAPVTSSISDNFDDGTIGALWTTYGSSVTETGGKVVLACDTGGSGILSASSYRLDNFHMEVTPSAANGGTDGYTTLLFIPDGQPAGTDLAIYHAHFGNNIAFASRTGFGDVGETILSYDSTAHRFWGFELVGSTLNFRTSPDGVTWTTRRTMSAPAWLTSATTGKIELDSRRNNGTANTASGDNLNLTTAITPVGSATDFWKYETTTSAPGVTPWLAVPRNTPTIAIAAGDWLVAVVTWNASEAPNMAAPTGWTVASGWPVVRSALVGQMVCYRKINDPVADIATDAEYTWQPKASDGTTNQSARGNVAIRAYRNVHATTPFDAAGVITQGTSGAISTANTITGVTTANANAYLINGISIEASSSGTTLIHDTGTKIWDLVGRRQAMAEEGLQAAAGASGSVTWTINVATLNYVGYQIALRPTTGVGATGSVVHLFTGVPTASGFVVTAKTSGATSARIKVSTTSDLLTSPVFSSAVTPDANGYARMTVTGLSASTDYYYRVELDGTLTGATGQAKTAPTAGTAASFTFAFGACSKRDSAPASFTRALARDPDMCLLLGDSGYPDVTTNDQAAFRSAWETWLGLSSVQNMVSKVPTTAVWSDHDFGGNNSNGSSASEPAAQAVYRQMFPHPTLQVADGIYHSWVYGDCLFIATDNRSFKSLQSDTDNSSKTVLGTTQKTWFKDLITNATQRLIIWLNELPWIGAAVAGDDEWSGYTTERTELANHIAASGKKLIIVSGDMHALAADDGTNSPGGIPVFHAGPWREIPSIKGGPYSSGTPWPGSGATDIEQYGFVTVTMAGNTTTVVFNGYDNTDTLRVTQTVTYPVTAAATLAVTATFTAAAVQTKLVTTNALAVTATLTTTAVVGAVAALPVTATLTAAAVQTKLVSASLPVTATLTAAGAETLFTTSSLPVTATLSAAAVQTKLVSASLPVTATLTAAADRAAIATSSLPVTATLTAAMSGGGGAEATLAVTATLTAAAVETLFTTSSLPVTATLTAAGVQTKLVTATSVAVTATLTAAAARTAMIAATLLVTATLAAAGVQTLFTTGTTVAVTATLTAGAVVGAVGQLSVTATLAAAAARTAAGTATLAVTVTLTTAGARTGPAAATLAVTVTVTTAGVRTTIPAMVALAVVATLTAVADVAGGITYRPFTGTTAQPNSGITPRPYAGITLY